MFRNWAFFQAPANEERERVVRTQTVKTQHIEIIGGAHSGASKRPNNLGPLRTQQTGGDPVLPHELITYILILAALNEQDTSSDAGGKCTPQTLTYAQVNVACRRSILARFILSNLRLDGLTEIQAFHRSLARNATGLREIAELKTKALFIGLGGDPQISINVKRPSLYEFPSRLQEFEKSCSPTTRNILARLQHLKILQLSAPPSCLCTPKSGGYAPDPLYDLKCHLQELTCMLTLFGGVGLEAIFTGTNKAVRHQPWQSLTHLQLHGPAGFRVSMSTASAIGSLPSLTHLGLVMPHIVRDASMADINSPPAALQLLVLLADTLETLLIVGHRMEGFLGWSHLYRVWTRALRLPSPEIDMPRSRTRNVSIRLVSVGMDDPEERTNPNFFCSWIVARARKGHHWDWSQAREVDRDWRVKWEAEEWRVPFVDSVESPTLANEATPSHISFDAGAAAASQPNDLTRTGSAGSEEGENEDEFGDADIDTNPMDDLD